MAISDLPSSTSDSLVIRRWILILLVLCLLVTVSLLIGISLQHFQLMSRLRPEDEGGEEGGENRTLLLSSTSARFRPMMLPSLKGRERA